MDKIAIVGAGGFGREVKFLIDQINIEKNKYEFVGFFDDGLVKGDIVNGFPVLGKVSDINNLNESTAIVIAVAIPQIRKDIYNKISNSFAYFPTLIHPNVIIGTDFVTVGKGSIICASTIITVNINIGEFVILNLQCTVGHDTIIKDFCSFMPSVNVSGEVIIEECVYVGTGAKIINLLNIGKNTIVGSGAVVAKSLPGNCTAVGIPAKPIKFHE
ncbi:acetyltransferase [Flavobacterium muglaense]|uniref:Acetyltransferase n=1 Tax=Flavobacterium muglaense TaxID=2764716 RepID=A0A923MZX3_9FLAO|nr:acetyltransferase [Flavobacterium muglaense]MBC5837046.1 acetyltransferase [Flavobacterium muglaense]MBC5843575.1 acetyltransferase [Flavobacterium muglaense]